MTEIEELRILVNDTVTKVNQLVKDREEARALARALYKSYADSPAYIGDIFPSVEFPEWIEE